MGIKNLNSFLTKIDQSIFQRVDIRQFAYEKVAIDVSLYMHKFKASAQERWLSAFINLIKCLRKNDVHCFFVFDGEPPKEKSEEREQRRETRLKMLEKVELLEQSLDEYEKTGVMDDRLEQLYLKKSPSPKKLLVKPKENAINVIWIKNKLKNKRKQLYCVLNQDFEKLKVLLDILNIGYYTPNCEAEKFCSQLALEGKVSAVLSDDTDTIAYNTPICLSKIDIKKNTIMKVTNEKLLKSLKLNKDELTDLCIMFGVDYNDNIPKIGPVNSYKLIQKYRNIDNIKYEEKLDISMLNHTQCRNIFKTFQVHDCNPVYNGCPNFEVLEDFLAENKIYYSFEKLKSYFIFNPKNILITESMKTISGDLIKLAKNGHFDVIIHGANCFNTMGAGIAKQIKDTWSMAYNKDCETIKGDKSKLGTYTMANVGDLIIVNAYTQYNYGRKQNHQENYKAIESVFKKIKRDFSGKKIGLSKIGAGLAGGNWNIISNIIETELSGEDVTVVEYKK